ncbi:uncharacterized protein LOC102903654 isoform X2 [Peromyscus maniculatus bairdii]|uniref:uncharacterized protein LOC102903654 isoform X2 n=1 Tax=Peromyscus maniculatus bairdii TaxID=230844 RepID=UPI003FD373D0
MLGCSRAPSAAGATAADTHCSRGLKGAVAVAPGRRSGSGRPPGSPRLLRAPHPMETLRGPRSSERGRQRRRAGGQLRAKQALSVRRNLSLLTLHRTQSFGEDLAGRGFNARAPPRGQDRI